MIYKAFALILRSASDAGSHSQSVVRQARLPDGVTANLRHRRIPGFIDALLVFLNRKMSSNMNFADLFFLPFINKRQITIDILQEKV